LLEKRDRSLARSMDGRPGDFLKLLKVMKLVDVCTPAGIYLGKDWAFDLNCPVMTRFIERLARALLWYEYKQPFFKGNFDFKPEIAPPIVYEGIQQYGRIRKVHDVFAYGIIHPKTDKRSWVVVSFFGWIEFQIRVCRILP
jgi:hypothetical protein